MEEGAVADGTADALGQEDLVVFRGDGGHHYAEDVEDGADEDDVAGAVVVEEDADEGALFLGALSVWGLID